MPASKASDPFKRYPTKTRGVRRRMLKGGGWSYAVSWKGTYVPVVGGEAEAIALQAQLRAGLTEPPEKEKAPDVKTVEEVLNLWLASKRKLRDSTADAYRDTINNRLIPKFGSYGIDAITVDDLAAWIIEMEDEGLSPSSIKKYTQPMRSTLAYAKRKKLVETTRGSIWSRTTFPRRSSGSRSSTGRTTLPATSPPVRERMALDRRRGTTTAPTWSRRLSTSV